MAQSRCGVCIMTLGFGLPKFDPMKLTTFMHGLRLLRTRTVVIQDCCYSGLTSLLSRVNNHWGKLYNNHWGKLYSVMTISYVITHECSLNLVTVKKDTVYVMK